LKYYYSIKNIFITIEKNKKGNIMILKDLVKQIIVVVDTFLTLVEASMLRLNDRVL